MLQLPHSKGCLVCGKDNPRGLHLSLGVDEQTGRIETRFTPLPEHIGFTGIVHGGILATVLDEAMVWAATWAGKRFCVCGSMSVRFRHSAEVGKELIVSAELEDARSKILRTTGSIATPEGKTIATGTATYVALPLEKHRAFVETLVEEGGTGRALGLLKLGAPVAR